MKAKIIKFSSEAGGNKNPRPTRAAPAAEKGDFIHLVGAESKEPTSDEYLSTIRQLVWYDTDAYLGLEAICSSTKATEIKPETREKLLKMHLIKKNGRPPLRVREIVLSIAREYAKEAYPLTSCATM